MYVDMTTPPDAAPPAAIGHNSRQHEIKRIADEIRAAYAKANIRETTPYRLRVMHAANLSQMSDAAFRMLFTYVCGFGDADGTSIYPSHETVAAVTSRAERSSMRAAKELEEEGWLTCERQRRGPMVRNAVIPKAVMKTLVFELLEVTNLSLLKSQSQNLEVPNLAPKKNQEVPNSAARPATSVTLPLRDNLKDLPDSASAPAKRVDPPNWQMAAALSPQEKLAQRAVWRVEGGMIAISDNLRKQLANDFPLVPIDPTLRIIKAESKATDVAGKLLYDIERKFSYAQRDEMTRDRRYAERSAQQRSPPGTNPQSAANLDKIRAQYREKKDG